MLFLPDEQSAERARTGLLGWDGSCLSDEDEQAYSIDPRLEPFTSGPWTGEIRTFAVQRPDPAAALRTGQAAIMHTLDRLPVGG
ncbi:hypothetical protein AB0L65_62335 [Nonomuraea sp. NPDC052116]|uniref:hypothetical protein n=1 Tax=Nonomuraea sp. NPDC052116 TaxID=3155665 RepID=UPI003436D7DF